jgi:transcriptional regulator with XRE-family HTH domain
MNEIASIIKNLREKNKISINQLSKKLNIDRRTISSIEKGDNCNMKNIEQILSYFGMVITVKTNE